MGVGDGDVADSLPPDLLAAVSATPRQPSSGMSGWLHKLSLGSYATALAELGVSVPSDVELLTDLELSAMGLKLLEKRKLRQAAKRMKEL